MSASRVEFRVSKTSDGKRQFRLSFWKTWKEHEKSNDCVYVYTNREGAFHDIFRSMHLMSDTAVFKTGSLVSEKSDLGEFRGKVELLDEAQNAFIELLGDADSFSQDRWVPRANPKFTGKADGLKFKKGLLVENK